MAKYCFFLFLASTLLSSSSLAQEDDGVIVVIAGVTGEDVLGLDTVETLRPDRPEGEQSCASLPFAADAMVAFFDAEGRPVVCGGEFEPPDSQQCYTAIDGVWDPTLRTLQDRVGEGSVAQLTDGRAFMFGGNTTDTYRTSEIYDPDLDDFIPGPELPYDSKFSCTVEVPGQPGVVFVVASIESDDRAYFFDVDSGEVSFDSTLPNPRNRVACGSAESALGGYDIVVAGGFPDFVTTVDVLNVDTLTWRPGPPLPVGLTGPGSSQTSTDPSSSSFLVIGGQASTGFLSSVYEYDGIGENWILRSDLELEVERGFVATTLARGDGLQCYDEE